MTYLQEQKLLNPGFRTVSYTYIGSELTWPIYWEGTLGKAKEDLDRAAATMRRELAPVQGDARVAVLKAVVTQASSAIPVVPLYVALLFKVMKEKAVHEDCIRHIDRLFRTQLFTDDTPRLDKVGRLRVDDWELHEDVQAVGADGQPSRRPTSWNCRSRRLPTRFSEDLRVRSDGCDYDATSILEPLFRPFGILLLYSEFLPLWHLRHHVIGDERVRGVVDPETSGAGRRNACGHASGLDAIRCHTGSDPLREILDEPVLIGTGSFHPPSAVRGIREHDECARAACGSHCHRQWEKLERARTGAIGTCLVNGHPLKANVRGAGPPHASIAGHVDGDSPIPITRRGGWGGRDRDPGIVAWNVHVQPVGASIGSARRRHLGHPRPADEFCRHPAPGPLTSGRIRSSRDPAGHGTSVTKNRV